MEDEDPAAFSPTAAILVTPWLWFPLATAFLGALLFVSFRRQRAIELYHAGKHYVRTHVESLSARSPIRLPSSASTAMPPSSARPPRLNRSVSAESNSSSNPADGDDDDDRRDELLPFSSSSLSHTDAQQRYASWQRRSRSMLDNLVDNVAGAHRNVVDSLGWGASDAARGEGREWKRMLLGTRDVDRGIGRIRLGDHTARAASSPPLPSRQLFQLGPDGDGDDVLPDERV